MSAMIIDIGLDPADRAALARGPWALLAGAVRALRPR